MDTLVLSGADVRRLLPMATCIDLVAGGLAALARGEGDLPLRSILWLPERRGAIGSMPSHLGGLGAMATKVVSVMPGNVGSALESHQGVVLLFEAERGRLLAIADAAEITAIRTAAASGLATRLLAREDAGDLALLGTGTQARTHLQALALVRPLRRVRVWGRDRGRAEAFVARERGRYRFPIEIVAEPEAAVRDADLICTTTAAKEPILLGRWLAEGAHVNAVGSCTPIARELDGEAVARARLYVDRRESALAEAGDFLLARAEGAVDDAHIVGELGEILIDRVAGRTDPSQITLFESLGVGIEDLVAVHHVHRVARDRGFGVAVALGGERD